MKKIPTLFQRNPNNMRELLTVPHPACSWVFRDEGIATRKYDGTCVKIEGGKYFKRRELKESQQAPEGFVEVGVDEETGKRVGWVPVDAQSKDNQWHMAAFSDSLPDGTYELCGPKVQGNPENFTDHRLVRHADAERLINVPRTFDGLREWLASRGIEGIVFHHPDGRMAKIKKRDFGLRRAVTL